MAAPFKERIAALLQNPCKCASGKCYKPFHKPDLTTFLDTFQKLGKREQDTVLFLALGSDLPNVSMSGSSKRRDYLLLGHPVRRVCMEHLLGISSHRTDRIGCIDMRFGQHPTKPSELTASIDAFCCVMYNSIAEPLPDKLAWLYVGIFLLAIFLYG